MYFGIFGVSESKNESLNSNFLTFVLSPLQTINLKALDFVRTKKIFNP